MSGSHHSHNSPPVPAGKRLTVPPLLRSLIKRIGWGLVTLWGVSIIAFLLIYVAPRAQGIDPAVNLAGNRSDEETLKNIRADLGLDRPLHVQYGLFVHGALTNNLKSYRNKDLVIEAIARRFPATLLLALAGMAVYLIISIPIGVLTAQRSGSALDRTMLFLGLIAISIPTFWLGRLLQYYVGYRWGWFSVGGGPSLRDLPLPALTLGLGGAAYYARLLHSNLRGVLSQDFIRSARARGLSERMVLGKHALKNALIPLITILGLDFASLLSGLIFTEKIFAWPGIGSLAVDSVVNADLPMIMGIVLFSSLMVVVMNIIVDLAYHIIDPRVRVE